MLYEFVENEAMNEVDKDYKLNVLKMVINTHLDETRSVTDKDLKSLEANRDRLVWELVAKIYSQSGHKVEFCMVRDVVNSRIEVMKLRLAAEAEKKARRIAEEKARQAEEARQIAQGKVRQAAAEEVRWAEERIRIRLGNLGEDEIKAKIFFRFRKIVSENLCVDDNKVNLDSHLSKDLGADDLDLVELLTVVEEEFEIEIPFEVAETTNGIVKNCVNLIYSKLLD